ncbi:hypothetical protein G5I_03816 [Acromyrmex echinatior]|uniref:Uncharacterized protein n=1 Tax=Acromyrmex echinatior TaxID=103372 RepID=F4WDZ0_ACREC|nr:hypothetical protein G5I_03816 [Acromyrmex echinatior]
MKESNLAKYAFLAPFSSYKEIYDTDMESLNMQLDQINVLQETMVNRHLPPVELKPRKHHAISSTRLKIYQMSRILRRSTSVGKGSMGSLNSKKQNIRRCSKKKSIIFPIDGFSNLYLVYKLMNKVNNNSGKTIRRARAQLAFEAMFTELIEKIVMIHIWDKLVDNLRHGFLSIIIILLGTR